ncbi:hypothetical protein EDC26_103319 [Paralcaligenes ureilyticus]|uniref:Uncharacterized protein n=1 Tax=Paralcaligenes ureilyticus TaxID=627131 RepID=A0A4R3MBS0_9BURK|nr:hypothetical protein EDC26_103319 [Paralcaligenes ureilyticus]
MIDGHVLAIFKNGFDGHVLTIFKNGSERDVAAALVAAISSDHPYATRLNSASPR